MADDTMEMSSEHGHNIGDEDIDIDIDFTAGHVDEDYVLEDAASNIGFEDDFRQQPSPAVGHADLMIDEDDESYPMPMDDGDAMPLEDNQHMEHETLPMSFTSANIPTLQFEEDPSQDTSHIVAAGSMQESAVVWPPQDEPDYGGNSTVVHAEHLEEGHVKDEEPHDNENTEEIKPPATNPPREDSPTNSPHNISHNGSITGEQPISPPASTSAPVPESADHVLHSDEAPGASSTSQDPIATIESASAEDTDPSSSNHEVIVLYQDSEYALFSKSESDDIDSFFLSDLSIKEKPLVNFFEAIRQVIHGDLTDEDELCMSIEDFGIEIEEVSCASVDFQ